MTLNRLTNMHVLQYILLRGHFSLGRFAVQKSINIDRILTRS